MTNSRRFVRKSNKPTKAIREMLASASTSDKSSVSFGFELSKLIRAAQFLGAKPSEHRGLSDAGLSSSELKKIAIEFTVPDTIFSEIVDALDE